MITLDPNPVTNSLLRETIELRMSDCFHAMNVANLLGGSETAEWKLVRKYGLPELIEEALDRGLPVAEFRDAVEKKRFVDCRCYLRVRDQIGGRQDFPI